MTKPPAFDRSAALAALDHDEDLLLVLVGVFFLESEQLIVALRESVRRSDGAKTAMAAHAFVGAVGNFYAGACRDAAVVLERMGRSCEMLGASDALERLEVELAMLRSEFESLPREKPPCAS